VRAWVGEEEGGAWRGGVDIGGNGGVEGGGGVIGGRGGGGRRGRRK